ncbi:hypothetical protein PPACK8108_LOCUS22300 [Phakopsora pachyrhizi]|uniref:Uncharacterized protein n=1 Tax=Phakopsora pachyrhizi TaxID=170000 RepID=A0AAV0BMB3_PHAPC|nr:hypothetical protein PPACK8108_LOCUS22300 [Phakopsora pachyrhizi]
MPKSFIPTYIACVNFICIGVLTNSVVEDLVKEDDGKEVGSGRKWMAPLRRGAKASGWSKTTGATDL